MDIVLAVLSPVVEHTIGPIKTHICYALYCKSNLHNLKEEVDKLKTAQESLQHRMDEETRNGKEIEEHVRNWRLKVDDIIQKMEKELAEDEERAKKKCFVGLCPNFKSRYQLGKKAKEELATVTTKIDEQAKFGSISYRAAPPKMGVTSTGGYQAMESRKSIFKDVMNALKISGVNMVGVYGMGGIGKTTLVKEVAREAIENKLFNKMVFASVTRTPDTMKIQGEIADQLDLTFDKESELGRANRLRESRMGYNASTEDLLKYGMGAGLFSDVATVEEARNRLHSLLHKLKTSSLLLDTDTSKQFSIHDVVRDVAISIAYRDRNVFVKSDAVELKWRDKDSLKKCSEIWLHCNSIGLPEDLKYPQLKVFIVNSGDPSLEISQNFFGGMQKLKVLGLSNLSFSSLHSSLHLLKHLRSLCLHQSSLGEGDQIAVIGELKKLEILSFVKSDVKHLPREIGQLTKLKLLDLSDCSELEMIAPNVISSLSLLEELCMGNSFHHWDIEGKNNASLVELEHLSHLTNLEIHIPDSRVISKDFSTNLERHRIVIGGDWSWNWNSDGVCETLRKLKLEFKESTDNLKHEILMLLKRIEDLYLLEVNGVKSVIELDKEGFLHLKHLRVDNSPEVQYIIDMINGIPSNVSLFPMLESLYLYNLASLEKIYHGILRARYFGKLKILQVRNCDKLRSLFSFSMALGLLQLQSITITSCQNMEEVVAEESEQFDNIATNVMEFTQLRFMSLNNLPLLRNFCSREKTSSLSQTHPKSTTSGMELGEVTLEDDMQSPTPLFDEKIVFPNLEVLELESMKMERLWHGQHPAITASIQNLQRLDVWKCDSLKYIFSTSMVKSLVQLEHLSVRNCESLEEIIVTEASDGEETTSKMLFPKLGVISIFNLPKLKQFCTGCLLDCPLLKELEIYVCSGLETFISECGSPNVTISDEEARQVSLKEKRHNAIQPLFNEKVAFPTLTTIDISSIDNLEKIWHDQLAEGSFSELRSLSIYRCHKLVNVFPSISLRTFQRLEVLQIENCNLLEEILELEGPSVEGSNYASLVFQLRDLTLSDLPKLKHIWNNNPPGTLSFQDVRTVRVWVCDDLKNIFPFSIARNLPQLEKLDIYQCGVDEIVAKSEGDETAPLFGFPQLTSLDFDSLPKLRNFYPGKHTWECPKLKSLAVSGCGSVKLFGSEFLDFQEIQVEAQHDNPIQQPLFFVEKVFSNLEELSLGGQYTSNNSIMSHRQLEAGFNSTLKVLKLHNFKGKSDRIPFGFLQRLRNVETLTIESSSFKRLFLNEGIVEEEHKWKPSLKEVSVQRCPNMKIFSPGLLSTPKLRGVRGPMDKKWWRGNLNATIQQLYTEMLIVDECAFVSNAIPSNLLKLMKNLDSITVKKCDSVEGVFDLIGLNAAEEHLKLLSRSIGIALD
ncbi:unnamed protein product [Dovyalis caffra]|uniref:NB-ARC domain-containing protein n=1 Tax=Dovyalis caffra TaxID=77055 RepID=A0AAV1RZ56_9ROSI|nr:unnamed protein product [Dovyalis caffra]